jgi:HD domain-containing protein
MASSDLGTVAWLERSAGRLTVRERLRLLAGLFGALREGLRLGRAARRGERRTSPLALFEPPDTPIVAAARAHLLAHSCTAMANHCFRTAFWTLFVLHEHGEVTPDDLETTWVAALLHDVGLEQPPQRGDFSSGGIDIVRALAVEHRWPDDRVHAASEAIAVNLSLRVDPVRSGTIAWAMNVGGAGEIGSPWHRAQMHPDRVAELEARFPRTEFRRTAIRLAREEARRVRGGRFALFRWIFPLIVRG